MRKIGVLLGVIALGICACSGNDQSPTALAESGLRSIQVVVPSGAAAGLSIGQAEQLSALGSYTNGSTADLTNVALWRTSNADTAIVSNDGVVTARATGGIDVTATLGSITGTLHFDVSHTCNYTLTPSHLVFSATPGSGSVMVTASSSDCRWSAKSDADWFVFTYDPGVSGSRSFSYFPPSNSTRSSRTAHIIVTGTDGATATHTFDQDPPLCSYVPVPDHVQIPASGGSGQFTVDATPDSCAWSVSSFTSGVAVTSPGGVVTGDSVVTFTVAGNASFSTATIRINASPSTSPSANFTITR